MSFLAFLPYFWRFWRQKHPTTTTTTTRIFVPNFLAPIGIFYEFIDEGTKKQISNFNLFTNLINYKQKTWKMILKVETVTIKKIMSFECSSNYSSSLSFFIEKIWQKILNFKCHHPMSCLLYTAKNFKFLQKFLLPKNINNNNFWTEL